jgi:hypothetical protein
MLDRVIDSCLVVSIKAKVREVLPSAGASLYLSSDRLWHLFFLTGLVVLLSPYFRDNEKQLSHETATSRWWIILGTAFVTASLLFLVIIRPNRSDDLKLFWTHPRLYDTYSLLRYGYNRVEVMIQTPFSVTLRILPLWLRFLLTSSPLLVF